MNKNEELSMKVGVASRTIARILNFGAIFLMLLMVLNAVAEYIGIDGLHIMDSSNWLILIWFIVLLTLLPVPEFSMAKKGKLSNNFLVKFKRSKLFINWNHQWMKIKLYRLFTLLIMIIIMTNLSPDGNIWQSVVAGILGATIYDDTIRLYRYNKVESRFKSIGKMISDIEKSRLEFNGSLPFVVSVVTSRNEIRKCRSIADINNLPDGLLEYVVVGFENDKNTMHFSHDNQDMTSKKTLYHELSDVDINGDRTPSGNMLINMLFDYRDKVIALEKSLEEKIEELYSFV